MLECWQLTRFGSICISVAERGAIKSLKINPQYFLSKFYRSLLSSYVCCIILAVICCIANYLKQHVHSRIQMACLDCSKPHNHIWKHYSWKTKEANLDVFSGNKQTIQNWHCTHEILDRHNCSTTGPAWVCCHRFLQSNCQITSQLNNPVYKWPHNKAFPFSISLHNIVACNLCNSSFKGSVHKI